MQDKLYKILKIRIDSINRNIDNLNYLNSELEKNMNDLNYIQEKIDLFGNNNVLAFDSLSRDEFEKVLLMLDPSVSDIFQDKTCNYQGIMYIIQGIRQGISLELTDVQANAIQTFIEEMINKKASLEDVIANLNESKKRLPEVDINILNNDLKKFQTIVSKLEENLYIIEIDDIIESLEFANTPLDEKVLIFEFLLKYNADIYATNQTPIGDIEQKDDYTLNEIDVPEFHYEPINIYDEITNKEERPEQAKIDIKPEDKKITPTVEIDKTKQIPIVNHEDDFPYPTFQKDIISKENLKEEVPKVEVPKVEIPKIEISQVTPIEIPAPNTNVEATTPSISPIPEISTTPVETSSNTAELEDIIGKIDAKLKEMETKTKDENSNVTKVSIPEPSVTETKPIAPESPVTTEINNSDKVKEILTNEGIISDTLTNIGQMSDVNVREVIDILKENELLDILKVKPQLLSQTLLVPSSEIKLVVNAINDIFDKKEHQKVWEIITSTMPTLLANEKVIDDFLKNINFYRGHGINLISLFDNYRELLIMDNVALENNYNLTKDYKIPLTDDNVKYLLGNKRVLTNLDYYLEAKGSEKSGLLGHEEAFNGLEYIIKNPYKLNNISRDALMKLRYASENGQKIYGNKPGILSGEITNPKVDVLTLPLDYKNLYFDNEYTFTSKGDLAKYKEELSYKKDFDLTISENILKLDSKYKVDDLRYKINGLTFSRLKTIRLYNFFITKNIPVKEAMLIALTYNSVIKRDEYLTLETEISNLLEGGN